MRPEKNVSFLLFFIIFIISREKTKKPQKRYVIEGNKKPAFAFARKYSKTLRDPPCRGPALTSFRTLRSKPTRIPE